MIEIYYGIPRIGMEEIYSGIPGIGSDINSSWWSRNRGWQKFILALPKFGDDINLLSGPKIQRCQKSILSSPNSGMLKSIPVSPIQYPNFGNHIKGDILFPKFGYQITNLVSQFRGSYKDDILFPKIGVLYNQSIIPISGII